MSVETQLGSLQLTQEKAGLQLTLVATVKASEPLPVRTSAELHDSKPKIIGDRLSWISRYNSLCFILAISASDVDLLSTLSEQRLLQSLGELLNEAEVHRHFSSG